MHSGRFSRGGKITTNIAHLSVGRFSEIEFPLPPLDEQQEIVNRAKTLFAFADRFERKYRNAVSALDKIRSSILTQAFRGELVSQNSEDEPANILLERIHSVKAEKDKEVKKVNSPRKSAMPKISKKVVCESIMQLPEQVFTFEDLRTTVSGDYDLLRDTLFDLLNKRNPIISQFFDGKLQTMKFSRRSQ